MIAGTVATELPRHLTGVDRGRAVTRDSLERSGELGPGQPIAGLQSKARRRLEHRGEDPVEVRLALRDLEPAVGELDRRLQQLRPGQRAVGAVRGLQSGRRAGNGARLGADAEELRLRALEDHRDRLRLGARAARHGHEEVEDARSPVARGVDEHEPAAAGPGQGTLGHP